MKITALMENTPFREGFLFEHGLSLHIETARHRVLFDTGASAGFAHNAAQLGIDLAQVDTAVLSHGHYDHGGGLSAFLALNDSAPVYVSQYAFDPFYAEMDRYIGLPPVLANHPRLRPVGEKAVLDAELSLFACNSEPRPFAMDAYGLHVLRDGRMIPDDFRHEQYLLIREGERRVLISGCSHKGILNIAQWFAPDVLIGGFHFMKVDPQSEAHTVLDAAAEGLLAHATQYYTCHCTGAEPYAYLKARMGKQLHYLAAGQQITL